MRCARAASTSSRSIPARRKPCARSRGARTSCSASRPENRNAACGSCSAHHGLLDHFITIKTADDAPSKPDPGMVLAAMREAGVDAAEHGRGRRHGLRHRDGACGGRRRDRRDVGLSSRARRWRSRVHAGDRSFAALERRRSTNCGHHDARCRRPVCHSFAAVPCMSRFLGSQLARQILLRRSAQRRYFLGCGMARRNREYAPLRPPNANEFSCFRARSRMRVAQWAMRA